MQTRCFSIALGWRGARPECAHFVADLPPLCEESNCAADDGTR